MYTIIYSYYRWKDISGYFEVSNLEETPKKLAEVAGWLESELGQEVWHDDIKNSIQIIGVFEKSKTVIDQEAISAIYAETGRLFKIDSDENELRYKEAQEKREKQELERLRKKFE